jgi:aldehyde:ferredoxin oxidoreductase
MFYWRITIVFICDEKLLNLGLRCMNGMNNNLLRVDLNSEQSIEGAIPEETMINYLGGRGLGVKLLTDNLSKGVDPLSQENLLIFTVGPLTSTITPTSGRFSLVTKSPLTNTIFHSNSGGYWGSALKRCGFDCVIIGGKLNSNEYGYIVIDGTGKIEIKDAGKLWGKTSTETVKMIQEIEGKTSHVLLIGPAGENLVKVSSIMNDAHRAFGRGGVGAVMGSKHLKALVVKGGRMQFTPMDKELMKNLNTVAIDKIKVTPITSQGLSLLGTAALVNIINLYGMFPAKNFQKAFTDANVIHNVSGEKLREEFFEQSEGCFNCIIRCGRLTNTGERHGKGPEYESLWALGPLLDVFDLKQIIHANYLCNELGLDTMSTGAVMACAMELHEKKILSNSDLSFGNREELCKIVEDVALRRGIGDELAEGSLRFSTKYHASKYAMQVKGLDLAAYDPRGAFGHALNYAVSSRGACHLTGFMVGSEVLGIPKKIDRFSIRGKSDLLFLKQNQSVVEDSLVVCKFVGYALGLEFQVRFLNCMTGKDFTISDLLTIGERVYTLERLFNVREGFDRKDDTLPRRFLEEPLNDGPSKNRVVPLDEMLDEFYKVRNWDENGIPTDKLLERLSIKRLS